MFLKLQHLEKSMSVFHFEKRLLLFAISLVGGGGTWAIVGEIRAESLVFRATICVTPSVSTSPQNFGYQNWHIFISLVYFDYFDIPPPGSGVVLPGDQLFT